MSLLLEKQIKLVSTVSNSDTFNFYGLWDFMRKYFIAALIRFSVQYKHNWSEVNIAILTNEFFPIQIYISGSRRRNIFAVFY